MPVNTIAEIFARYGAEGIMVVVLIYNTGFLQRKLISIIENNTKAMTNLTGTIDRFMDHHCHN